VVIELAIGGRFAASMEQACQRGAVGGFEIPCAGLVVNSRAGLLFIF
jgi:hypothetical protein